MLVSLADQHKIAFYKSRDLKSWSEISQFGNLGDTSNVWECPDLFPLIAENGQEYWVLIQNMNPGNPNGGSGTQYFIGQFDGKEFKVDENFTKLLGKQGAVVPEGFVFEDFEKIDFFFI